MSMDSYHAHKALSSTILRKINEVLKVHSLEMKDIEGILIYSGPGSFTGLRIGITLANALSDSLDIPISEIRESQEIEEGLKQLIEHPSKGQIMPFYGAAPHITQAKK